MTKSEPLERMTAERDAYQRRAEVAEKELTLFRLGPQKQVRCQVLFDEGEKRRKAGLFTAAIDFYMAASTYASPEAQAELRETIKKCEHAREAVCDR